jgi:hypothetical protein
MYGASTSGATVYRCAQSINGALPGQERCSCRSVRADVADEVVWDEVRRILGDPNRLLALAEVAADEVEEAGDTADTDLAAIERRIARLERASGEQLAKALAAGVDPVVAQHAAEALHRELDDAKRNRSRLIAWQAANAERADRRKRLWELAGRAQATLAGADIITKQRVLDLLEVRVTVTGWFECETCSGKGLLAVKEAGEEPQRVRGRTGRVCPTCHRHRWIPHLGIEGVVPDVSSLNPDRVDPTVTGWPFRIASAG